ncbi:glycosyltransferase family 39 protein [Candidatus Sumerlaeota bacterium]|nr:glycosyltransferase family 39 protein [Candidatus Sumerlaeota bacterium]
MPIKTVFSKMPREYVFLLVQVLGLLVLFALVTPLKLKDPAIHDESQTYAFTAGEQTQRIKSSMQGNWAVEEDGAIATGSDASVELPLPQGPWVSLRITIIGDEKFEWVVTAQRGFERMTRLKVFAGQEVAFEGAQLPGKAGPSGEIKLRIAPKGTDGGRIERIHVRLSAYTQAPMIAPLPAVFFAALFPLAVFFFLHLGAQRTPMFAMRVTSALSILAIVAFYFRPDVLRGLWIAASGLFLATTAAPFIRALRGWKENTLSDARSLRLLEVSAALAIVGFALWLRWDALLSERLLPLRHDAIGYVGIALQGTFYNTALQEAPWVREPLFPALIRLAFTMLSASETIARSLAVFIGALVPLLTYIAGRRIFSPLAAFLAAGVLVVNPFLVTLSTSVLRDDLLSVLFLAFLCVAIYAKSFPLWRAVGIGVVASALALTRLSNLFLLPPIIGWMIWKQRWSAREMVLCIVIFLAPVLPHLAFNARIGGGDYFHSATVHTPYYVNRLNIGEANFPSSLAEWNADPYRKVASRDSLLTSGGVVAGIQRIFIGYAKIFLLDFPHGDLFRGNELIMAFGLIGAWVLWRRRDAWWVAASYIVFMFPVAVIAGIVFDHRLAAPAAPMILLAWGAGVDFAIANAWLMLLARKKRSA